MWEFIIKSKTNQQLVEILWKNFWFLNNFSLFDTAQNFVHIFFKLVNKLHRIIRLDRICFNRIQKIILECENAEIQFEALKWWQKSVHILLYPITATSKTTLFRRFLRIYEKSRVHYRVIAWYNVNFEFNIFCLCSIYNVPL